MKHIKKIVVLALASMICAVPCFAVLSADVENDTDDINIEGEWLMAELYSVSVGVKQDRFDDNAIYELDSNGAPNSTKYYPDGRISEKGSAPEQYLLRELDNGSLLYYTTLDLWDNDLPHYIRGWLLVKEESDNKTEYFSIYSVETSQLFLFTGGKCLSYKDDAAIEYSVIGDNLYLISEGSYVRGTVTKSWDDFFFYVYDDKQTKDWYNYTVYISSSVLDEQ